MKGMLVEFESPERIIRAANKLAMEGYSKCEAYTPFHVEGLAEIMGTSRTRIPLIGLLAGFAGAGTGYLLQFYTNAVNYPLNVGGRPLNSIPAFVPISFELGILFASVAIFISVFFAGGMPDIWRPIFNVAEFERASQDGFFLLVDAKDAKFDPVSTKNFLESLGPRGVYELP